MKRYWMHMVKTTERTVEHFLERQIRDENSMEDGRMPSEVVEGKHTIYLLADAVSLYCCVESKYYHSSALMEAIERGIGFIERWQRPDGSLDFPTCNFYSAPDTAFCFRRLYGAYRILEKYGEGPRDQALMQRYRILLLKCIPIMLFGGFHTPNHRWAVMATLHQLVALVEEHSELAMNIVKLENCSVAPEYLKSMATSSLKKSSEGCVVDAKELIKLLQDRAVQYLSEGIDGDEDGEYAERSTGNYNAVVDKSLISAYEATGREEFLGFVERNLEMMLYYFDTDDTIFTQNSTRQDKGKALYPDQYFYLYTYMAAKTGKPLFDAAAHKIIKDNLERGDEAQDSMYIFMMYDWLKEYSFQSYGFLPAYRKYFKGSQVLRTKNDKYVATILNHKAAFLFLKFGSLPIGLRIGEAYCDIRSFIPEQMEVTPDGCILKTTAKGWYYQPFTQKQETADWWAMDHKKRDLVITSEVAMTVTIKELEKGLEIKVKTQGLQGLPLRVEVQVPVGCVLENETFCLTANPGESLILRDGYLRLHDGGAKKILIGPGYGTHAFKGHYSGEERNTQGYSIFLNDYTPYERTFQIVEES